MVVSALWRETLLGALRDAKPLVGGNGVDARRFPPISTDRKPELRGRLGLGSGPVFLCDRRRRGAQEHDPHSSGLRDDCIAPGPTRRWSSRAARACSIIDAYQAAFGRDSTATAAKAASAVSLLGPVADADMPRLYRLASALVFASVKEGFGLCVLEAMASGVPGRRLGDRSLHRVISIRPMRSGAIRRLRRRSQRPCASARPDVRALLRARGPAVAARFGWRDVARAPSAGLPPLAGARPCLRCGSSSAGPMAGARVATRPRWSSRIFFARARAILFPTSCSAAARRCKSPRSGSRRSTAMHVRWRSANSRASKRQPAQFEGQEDARVACETFLDGDAR